MAYAAGLTPGSVPATPEQLRQVGGKGCAGATKSPARRRAPSKKKAGCQKQGPGCASEACNQCAEQAIGAIDYYAGLQSLQGVTAEQVRGMRWGGGVDRASPGRFTQKAGDAFGDPINWGTREISMSFESCAKCISKSWDAWCQEKSGSATAASDSHGDWVMDTGFCEASVSCHDTESNCWSCYSSAKGTLDDGSMAATQCILQTDSCSGDGDSCDGEWSHGAPEYYETGCRFTVTCPSGSATFTQNACDAMTDTLGWNLTCPVETHDIPKRTVEQPTRPFNNSFGQDACNVEFDETDLEWQDCIAQCAARPTKGDAEWLVETCRQRPLGDGGCFVHASCVRAGESLWR